VLPAQILVEASQKGDGNADDIVFPARHQPGAFMSPRTPITSDQRFIGDHRCPICGGAADDPHGEGVRCYGYLSSNGHYAHCTRENHASRLPLSGADTYAHRLSGDCRCGRPHDPAVVRQRDRIRAGMERERAQPTDLTRFEVRALDGTVVAIKVRQEYSDGRKTFWWEQPDGTKALGDRAVTSLPLYGTEWLANAAPDALVILCEGEKKTHALTSRGFLALGTVTGASTIPDDDVLRSLLGRRVILWADNDRGGHAHMRKIAKRLKALGHTDVRMLRWPDAPVKGDASDFFTLGGTVETLNELMTQAAQPAETVSTPTSAAPRTVTAPPAGTLVDIHQRTRERERQQRRVMLTNPSPEDVQAWERQREQERQEEEKAAQRVAQLQQVEALLQTHIDAGDPHALLSTLRESALSLEERRPYVDPFIQMIAFLPRTDQDILITQAHSLFHVSTVTMREQIAALSGPVSQGPSLVQDPPPWPDAVNGAELLNAMAEQFSNFLVLPDHGADALALWCLFSYCLDAFDIAPILSPQSPTKRCGKSRALDVIQIFVRRPISVSNVSAAALFRTTERYQPTLIADEGDTFMGGDKGELHGVYNSSWSRTAAFVLRVVGDALEPKLFSTWGPKVIALIGALKDTMQDRSIVIPMRRRLKHEQIAKLRRAEKKALRELELNRRALRWATDHVEALSGRDPVIPVELEDDDRAADNWSVLLAIADEIGGDWPARARAAAVSLSGGGRRVEDRSAGIELLRDLHALAKQSEQNRMSTKEIIRWLTMNPGTWSRWDKGKPITETQLAGLLEPFGPKPHTIRIGASTPRGYTWSDFTDVFTRYLASEPLSEPQQVQQVNKSNKLDGKSDPQQDASVAGPKSELSAGKNNDVAPVAGEKSEPKTKRTPVSVPKIKRTPVGVISVAGQDATTRPKRTPVH